MDDLRKRLYDNGVLDFLLKERKAGRIRNLGWSFHGDVKVFDYLLSLDIPWDFVQIQLNYVDWKNASGWNVNAEYLYGELEKRNIPVVIMEPLLGGRLSRLNALSLAKLKQMRPDDARPRGLFGMAGLSKRSTDRAEWYGVYGAFTREHPNLLAFGTDYGTRK